MGYTTEFSGCIEIDPPLSADEAAFLTKFAQTRRMKRERGPYFVDGTDGWGQGKDGDIADYNAPPEGQPGLWCQWVPSADGKALEWDGGEKFYEADAWMAYIMGHFIGSDPIAPKLDATLSFLKPHKCKGVIKAQGEEDSDRWRLKVDDSKVYVLSGFRSKVGDTPTLVEAGLSEAARALVDNATLDSEVGKAMGGDKKRLKSF